MKKKFLMIVVILNVLLFSGCGIKANDITQIDVVDMYSNEISTVDKESDIARTIIDSVNKKNKTNENIPDTNKFEINIKSNSEVDTYVFTFDTQNTQSFISKDDVNYKVEKFHTEEMLRDETFYGAYVNKSMPEVKLVCNGEEIPVNIEYDWFCKDIDDTFINKSGTYNSETTKINLKDKDNIKLLYKVAPDVQRVKVYTDGNLTSTSENIQEAIKSIKCDGEYYFEIETKWNEKSRVDFNGTKMINFTAQVDNSADLSVLTRENYPGNILIVFVENLNEEETVSLKTDAVKVPVNAFPYKNKKVAMMPIDLYTVPGEYEITALFNEGMKNEYTETKTINVQNKEFKTQYLTVSEEISNDTRGSEPSAQYAKYVKAARENSTSEKLWRGEFIKPIEGILTTDYAEIRYVNNEKSSSRHSGIDLAAPKGTTIAAANKGKVVLADEMILTGNTVVIDHGMGLFTTYYHQDTMKVKAGDMVEKGDIIGTVGTTGFSTGPHLHYTVSIYNSYVNPYQAMSGIID